MNNYHKTSVAPTMEVTTCVPRKGCIVDCIFCPQRLLEKKYEGERYLSLDNFKILIDKIPQEVRITFAGFVEPWLNKECSDMILYAHSTGHPVSAFTTGIGMNVEDVDKIKDIPYVGEPNGGFALHLPDEERLAKHPISAKYIKVLQRFRETQQYFKNFYVMSMGPVHPEVRNIFPDSVIPSMWSRAGNLLGEAILKPELINYKDRFRAVYHGEEKLTCNCIERLYHNVLMPNGDVSLCCMDYNLDNILGNLYNMSYDELIPKPKTCFDICRFCENGISPEKIG